MSGIRIELPSRSDLESRIQTEIIDKTLSRMDERRQAKRCAFSSYVQCNTLDEEFQLIGKEFAARCRDISITGIGLTVDKIIRPKTKITMELPLTRSEWIQAVGEVIWCRPRGHFQAFYDLGLRFLVK